MKVYKLTPEMIGKKVTCKIHDALVEEGILGYSKERFYIAQNVKQGFEAPKLNGFTKTWGIDGTNMNICPNGITDFELIDVHPQYEIY